MLQYRAKNLPAVELMNTFRTLCEDSPNHYDQRTHLLTVSDWGHFVGSLRTRLNRGIGSFEKQLRMAGFKKQIRVTYEQNDDYNQEERYIVRYLWKGRRDEYIHK